MGRMPGPISLNGVARPTPALRRRLGILYGERAVQKMDQVLDDAEAVEALARLLKERVEARATADGRVDYRDVAADVIAAMRGNQKP